MIETLGLKQEDENTRIEALRCMYEYTHHSTGQVGQRRGHFLGKDDSCDSTLAI